MTRDVSLTRMFAVGVAGLAALLTVFFAGAGTTEAGVKTLCKGQLATIEGSGTITGTPFNDVIVGSPSDDAIDAKGGNDVVCGRGGPDHIQGWTGNDELLGEGGNDDIIGHMGDDVMRGNEGSDTLRDLLDLAGHDLFFGGDGFDICLSLYLGDEVHGCEVVPG